MRRPLRLLLPLAALITVSSCKGEEPAQPPPPKVQAATATQSEFTEGVDTVSTLEATSRVELAAQESGRILELKIRQGDQVEPGQLLLVLDQVQTQAELARARAKLAEEEAQAETAKTNLDRYEYLAKQGAASEKQRDSYRTQYNTARERVISAKEQIKSIEANLSYSNLRAPSGGFISDVLVKVGDVINKGQTLTSIVQNNELEARVEVPAVFSERLAIGQPVLLSAPGSDAVIATGKVDTINPQINTKTQGLLVKAVFNNPNGKLLNGQRLRTRVLIKAKDELSVPFAAVTQTSGQSFVFRLGSFEELKANPGKADIDTLTKAIEAGKIPASTQFAIQTPVKLGELENDLYPITEGLIPNAKVATTNLLNLKHGMPVQILSKDAAASATPAQEN
ncbi:efflux RND transporter periplasmic adaptor subunit [Synechococcus sp. CC9616]|uniref:efflux RND transporter periplasmic adaptor subunit n=1 Tax=Synechococcus sp. CC9616 TaxID=110663 RepID=UPI00048F0135|nr:efflux RND transporter periplasmic adaptor subunit [Synechococcus sp. CC9616]